MEEFILIRKENLRSYGQYRQIDEDDFVDLEPEQFIKWIGGDKWICENVYREVDSQYIYCPICQSRFKGSDYLSKVFTDEKMIWLSNMVTHFRHIDHRTGYLGYPTCYDRTWGRGGYGWDKLSPQTHDEAKDKQNEIAKRKIIKQCAEFLLENQIGMEHFKNLQSTTEQTLKVAVKYLKNNMIINN